MIAYLEGLLAETWGTSCIVVTRGGVGYELDLPAHTMASLPGRGESVALYTSLVVREDAQQLFGFATFEERQVFEVLLTISKVGARTALAILSLYRPDGPACFSGAQIQAQGGGRAAGGGAGAQRPPGLRVPGRA